MGNLGLLIEYEDVLLGKRKDFSHTYMGKNALQSDAEAILHFVFEDLLNWTPEQVMVYVTPELIDKLHIRRPVGKMPFPKELDKQHDLYYLAWIMYPDTANSSKQALTLRAYTKVLDGTLAKFPKNFFSNADGELHASICLRYAINRELYFTSIGELYKLFADARIKDFLKRMRLLAPCNDNYEYPIDMLHNALPDPEKNEFYYIYGRFLADMAACRMRSGKDGTA